MATHSSILSWRILWTEEPGRLQSMGSQRVAKKRLLERLTISNAFTRHKKKMPLKDVCK